MTAIWSRRSWIWRRRTRFSSPRTVTEADFERTSLDIASLGRLSRISPLMVYRTESVVARYTIDQYHVHTLDPALPTNASIARFDSRILWLRALFLRCFLIHHRGATGTAEVGGSCESDVRTSSNQHRCHPAQIAANSTSIGRAEVQHGAWTAMRQTYRGRCRP